MRGGSYVVAVAAVIWGTPDVAFSEAPMSRRVEQFDDFHGTRVADPYRWLEEDVRNSTDVADWVQRQNEHTFAFLERIEERERIDLRVQRAHQIGGTLERLE